MMRVGGAQSKAERDWMRSRNESTLAASRLSNPHYLSPRNPIILSFPGHRSRFPHLPEGHDYFFFVYLLPFIARRRRPAWNKKRLAESTQGRGKIISAEWRDTLRANDMRREGFGYMLRSPPQPPGSEIGERQLKDENHM